MLKALGIESEFINGLRVTTKETRDVALMVLAGRVNKGLVAALGALGQPAVGLCGGDGLIFRARKKRTAPDLGFVGEIASSDPRWIEAIWQLSSVPVISSMALGFDGEYYNVNADEMAAACAIACNADALVFLTDVPGVKGANGEVLRWLSIDQIAEMAQSAVISGGMLPKLGACREALVEWREAGADSSRRGCRFPARPVQHTRDAWDRSDGGLRIFWKMDNRRSLAPLGMTSRKIRSG